MSKFFQDPITSADRKRLLYLSLGIFVLFSMLIVKFYQIQIVDGEKWSKEAQKQHYLVIREPFKRGVFYSNTSIKKGHPESVQAFVSDIQMYHLFVDPESIPAHHRNPIIKNLIQLLDLPQEEYRDFVKQFYRKSRSRKLAVWIENNTREAILEWWNPYARRYKIPRNALFFVTDYKRSYPFGKLLGQVLHTIQGNKDEVTKQAIPTGGLELYYHKYLTGKLGKKRLIRSPRNSFETGDLVYPPENGADIYLTINHHLQTIAEEEIEKGVKKAKAKGGWVVIMEPFTGEVLALAQYPYFYPPDYQWYFNDPTLTEHTRAKAITDANEPGSVMKPITLAIAFMANEELRQRGEKPIFAPEEKMATHNGRFKGRSKLLTDTHFHSFLNMDMALQKSSNIYMAKLVEAIVDRLGKEWYREKLLNFGFGLKTNIELPAESPGLVPTPGKKHPNGALEWSGATPYSLAMGHNIQSTSIQIARAHAVFANGGYLVQPTLIRKIVKHNADGSEQTIIDHLQPERKKAFPQVLNNEIVNRIVRAMKFVTKPGGTATRASVWGYTEAGKSGSGNKVINGVYSNKYCPVFVGFTPVSHPAFVIVVTIDEPEYGYEAGVGKRHHGGTCAAPVFREIASQALKYLGVPPDDPHGYPNVDPRHDPEKADWLPETRKLQEMYESWNKRQAK